MVVYFNSGVYGFTEKNMMTFVCRMIDLKFDLRFAPLEKLIQRLMTPSDNIDIYGILRLLFDKI